MFTFSIEDFIPWTQGSHDIMVNIDYHELVGERIVSKDQ
jgi:hypothetical protein